MRSCPACGGEFDGDVKFCPDDGAALTEPSLFKEDGSYNSSARLGCVLGSYRLMGVLGEGGMGTVYLAEHVRLGRRVAVKVLHPEYAVNPNLVKRFFGEARAVNQIVHENIVEITDFIDGENEKYIVMELLAGMPLSDLLKHEGCLPIPRVLRISTQICNALVAVHQAGVIHRDLKPANIFITDRSGQYDFIKLLDFGIAKLTDTGGDSLAQTAVGAVLGTPGYVAPEQLTGKEVDGRADIYAVGVLLYQMVTGRKPLGAKSFGEMVLKQLTASPPRPSELEGIPHKVPRELEDLILQCLARDPELRPKNMAEVEERLLGIEEDDGHEDTQVSKLRQPVPTSWIVIAAAATVVVAVWTGLLLTDDPSETKTLDTPKQRKPEQRKTAPTPTQEETKSSAIVEIAFESEPTGAEVYLPGNDKPLGMAPFTTMVKRSSEPGTFEFRLTGHQTVRRTIPLQEDARIIVTLPGIPRRNNASARRRTQKPKTKRRVPRLKSRRGTLDPFADE